MSGLPSPRVGGSAVPRSERPADRSAPADARGPAPDGAAPARCTIHAAAAAVGRCAACGRALCVACAIPVRGTVLGPECLSTMVEDAPEVHPAPARSPSRARPMFVGAFALATLLSILPWSRFGGSNAFDAWDGHWSLVACACAVAGLAVATAWGRIAVTIPRAAAITVEGILGAALALAALAFHGHPPLLAGASAVPLLAAACGAVALGAAVVDATLGLTRRRTAGG